MMNEEIKRAGWRGMIAVSGIGALLLSGCATYHAKPISQKRVNAALEMPAKNVLQIRANALHHPMLPPVKINLSRGLTPDGAAVLAVILNPGLRAARDEQKLAEAAVLQAGILPNPQLSYNRDFVTGGNTAGTMTAYGMGLSWNVVSLITRSAKVAAARKASGAVVLNIAWKEWQTAEAAKLAAYDLIALRAQRDLARKIDAALDANSDRISKATKQHNKTLVDLAAAEAVSHQAHANLLALDQQVARQRLILLRRIGLGADSKLVVSEHFRLPDSVKIPSANALLDGLDTRRLDLVALRSSYGSQEEKLREAVLAQFPKIGLGFNHASDTTNVHTTGFGVTFDLPIFDRNQGVIAKERATRKILFDQYTLRVFSARSDVALAISDLKSLNKQIAEAQASLPILQKLVKGYRESYAQGNTDAITYYTAVSDLEREQLTLLKLQQQLLDNKVALELASGEYLSDQAMMRVRGK